MAILVSALIIVVCIVVCFLIFRWIVLWYWKIDKIEDHLYAIRNALEKMSRAETNKERQLQSTSIPLGRDTYEKKS